MTDRDTLTTMFNRVGVVWHDEEDFTRRDFPQAASAISVRSGDGAGNDGYTFFFTTFVFDGEGNLLCVGAWE